MNCRETVELLGYWLFANAATKPEGTVEKVQVDPCRILR